MKGSAVVVGLLAVTVVGVGVAMAASSGDKPGSFTVTGKSGTVYTVKFVKAFSLPDGRKQSFWDLFVGPLRIVRYSQLENDRDSRVFIVSPLGPTDPRVGVAMTDFGITFVGGPVAELVSTTATPAPLLAGQVVVSPGSWMATADVGFPKSVVVSAGLIRDALKEQGWRQVNVMTKAPANWPISKEGNYFVEAVWSGAPRIFQLPSEVVDIRSRALA
jgi:hypothetical protein